MRALGRMTETDDDSAVDLPITVGNEMMMDARMPLE